MSAGIGAAVAGIAIGSSLKTYAGFEQAMAQTAGTAGITQTSESYAKMEKAARDAGKATTKTAEESANALQFMALAGWSVDDSIKGLMPILRLSEATQADLATTSDLVTDSMSALGLSVDQLEHYLNVATVANNKSNQTAQMLMEAYIGVGGTLNRLGTPLNEGAALLGVLANRGIKASEAGNSLNSLLINLTKEGGESAKAMKALKINPYDGGEFKGITAVLKELNEKTKNLSAEQRDMYLQMIGGKTQITTLNALMSGLNTVNAEGINELDALSKQLMNTDGALDQMAETVNNTMSGAFARMKSAVNDAKIELGSKLAPCITPLINFLSEKIPNATEKLGKSMEKAKLIVTNFLKLGEGHFTWSESKILKQELSSLTGISENTLGKIGSIIWKLKKGFQNFFIIIKSVKTLLSGGLYFYDLDKARKELSRITGIDTTAITNFFIKIQHFFGGGGLKIAVPILMGIVSAFGAFIVVTKVTSFLSKLVKTGGQTTKVLKLLNLTMLANPFTWVAIGIGVLVAAFVIAYQKSETFRNFIQKLWDKFKEFGQGIKESVIVKLQELGEWFGEKIQPKLEKLKESFMNFWNNVLKPIAEWLQPVFAAQFQAAFSFIADTINNVIEVIKGVIAGLITALSGVLDFITGVFIGDWSLAWSGVKDTFCGILEGIGAVFKGIINRIINGINFFTAKLDWIPEKLSTVPGFSWAVDFKIPKIPNFATGTQYFQGGLARINEHGGEIVNLPSGTQIIPADKSNKILNNQNPNINVNINVSGNMFGTEESARQMGAIITREILLAMENS